MGAERPAAGGPVPSPRSERSPTVPAAAAIAGAAWEAAARGDLAAVPREAWVVSGAGIALVLVLLLARRPPDRDRREPRPRRRHERIDWSALDRGGRADDDAAAATPRVAA